MQIVFKLLIFLAALGFYQFDVVFAQEDQKEHQLEIISDVPPSVDLQEQPDRISLEVKINDRSVKLLKSSIPTEALESFTLLGIESQTAFLSHRKEILELMSKTIYYPALAAGVGVVTKNKIVKFFKSGQPQTSLANSSDEIRISFLQMVESTLWSNIKLVQDSNEYGLHLNVGLVGVMGAFNKGRGGALGLFMNFSYNKEQRALAFEIGFEQESYHRSVPGAVNFALFWKAYPYLSYVDKNKFHSRSNGLSNYPPGILGSTTIDNKFFGLGYTDSPIGFPSIFSAFMYYQNKVTRTTLVRFSLSRSGVSMNSVITEVVFEKIAQLKDIFKLKAKALPSCHGIF